MTPSASNCGSISWMVCWSIFQEELVSRVAEGRILGALPSCPKCKHGQVPPGEWWRLLSRRLEMIIFWFFDLYPFWRIPKFLFWLIPSGCGNPSTKSWKLTIFRWDRKVDSWICQFILQSKTWHTWMRQVQWEMVSQPFLGLVHFFPPWECIIMPNILKCIYSLIWHNDFTVF